MHKYNLEFVLHTQNTSNQIKGYLQELGDKIEITDCQNEHIRGRYLRINIQTEDPTIIFDTCAQFGRIKTVKVDEIK
jgi:dihydroxyacetone kinase-like predicted kinase